MQNKLLLLNAIALATLFSAAAFPEDNDGPPILPQLPVSPLQVISTVPANGDLNPYGVAFVPPAFAPGGVIHSGDILVSISIIQRTFKAPEPPSFLSPRMALDPSSSKDPRAWA